MKEIPKFMKGESHFSRAEASNASEDDFFTITIGGIQPAVFRRLVRGKRSDCYYVKFTVKGKQFMRSTGESKKTAAADVARKIVKAALEDRWDALETSKLRQSAVVPPEVLRERIAEILRRFVNGEGTDDTQALGALESAVSLPPELRKFAGSASVLRKVKEACVYVLVKDGVVVYIGQTNALLRRLYAHNGSKDFDEVYYFSVPATQLNLVERTLIAAFPHCRNKDAGLSADGSPYITRQNGMEDSE